ncbi:MAG TPA: type VI secretion system-associated protein TagF [Steroidobacteraceae bacterium]
MSSAGPSPETVGWFGKIPALGDFVGRGLPASLLRPWDEWLSAELSEARALLAESWAASYRQAPTLCFVLGPGSLDGQAWQGILLPSVDRVGREFPLTIAQCRAPLAVEAPESPWWGSLVTLGQQIRESSRSADAVDEALGVFVRRSLPPGQSVESDGWQTPPHRAAMEPGKSAWWRFSAGPLAAGFPAAFDGLPRGAALRGLFGLAPE